MASSPQRHEQARRLGADLVVDSTDPDWTATVAEATGGVDVVLECAGGASLATGLGLLAPFGRMVVLGMASGEPGRLGSLDLDALLYDPALNQSVRAFNLGVWFGLRPQVAAAALGRLVGWVAAGDVEVPVGDVLPLDQAAEAHRRLEGRVSVGKLILHPWE